MSTIEVNTRIPVVVNVSIDDLIDAFAKLPGNEKLGKLALFINEVYDEDLPDITEDNRQMILKWLDRQTKRFTKP